MIIEYFIKPLLDAEYKRGYSAGVSAEKLVKAKEDSAREYDILRRGKELGRQELIKELETETEEISADEFNQLAEMEPEPFGFVGPMENITLVLEGE